MSTWEQLLTIFVSATTNCIFTQSSVSANQPVFNSGGVLMAEFLDNTLSTNPDSQSAGSDDPFRVVDASLLSNAYVQLRLRFNRNDEVINLQSRGTHRQCTLVESITNKVACSLLLCL